MKSVNAINKDETKNRIQLNEHEINITPKKSNGENVVETVLHFILVQQYSLNQGLKFFGKKGKEGTTK